MPRISTRIEFGDFQTPANLAASVCATLIERDVSPRSILEPTCGRGSFLCAAAKAFAGADRIIGVEINPEHSRYARESLGRCVKSVPFEIITADFFSFTWESLLRKLPQPVLVIGNPPWVTNADLTILKSRNMPKKSNFQNHRGIDAITGKGNFDISEYILLRAIDWLNGTSGTLAMLCKTAIARKILLQAWKKQFKIKHADIYRIDANMHFDAAVDSCLLVIQFSPNRAICYCGFHETLSSPVVSTFGIRGDRLIADVATYTRWQHLDSGARGTWRSGIKHDCSKVMQFVPEGSIYRNGLGERVELEHNYLYPMLKSSDLAKHVSPKPRYYMLVPQRFIGEPTGKIRTEAPQTWKYLIQHAELLDKRSSSIYRKKPRFSIFGVGEYSFTPWKVAIAGMYKTLAFRLISSFNGRPVVMDDTCYFCAFDTKRDATVIFDLLTSQAASEFFSSLIFWDEKRPITANLLNRLNLFRLAKEMGRLNDLPSRLADIYEAQMTLF